MKNNGIQKKSKQAFLWGVGLELEAILLSKHTHPRMVRSDMPAKAKYPVREAISLTDSIIHRLKWLMHSDRYPMKVTLDHTKTDDRTLIEMSTQAYANRCLWEYVQDIETTRRQFLDDFNLMVLPYGNGFSEAVWPIQGADYILDDSQAADIARYLGSYHINVTLPHAPNLSDKTFIEMHQTAAMGLQWIEPLLMSVLGCPNPASVLDGHQITEMSVRHSEEPRAMAISSDLASGFSEERTLESFVGQHNMLSDKARFHADLKHLQFPIDKELQLLREPGRFDPTNFKDIRRSAKMISTRLKRRISKLPLWLKLIFRNAGSSPLALKHFIRHRYATLFPSTKLFPPIGHDFRRDLDGKGTAFRFGFEFRLLDYFPPEYLVDVLRLLFYVMDSTAATPPHNAFEAESIHKQYILVILEGWNTRVRSDYLHDLRSVFGFHFNEFNDDGTRIRCSDLVNMLSVKLFNKYGRGRGAYSKFVDKKSDGSYYPSAPEIQNINQSSWEHFFKHSYPQLADIVMSKPISKPITIANIFSILDGSKTKAQIREDLEEIRALQFHQVLHHPAPV